MGTQTKPKVPLVRALSWTLALVLALGGWPAPALQELAGIRTARADEAVSLTDETNTQADAVAAQPDGTVAAQPDGAVAAQPDGTVAAQPDGAPSATDGDGADQAAAATAQSDAAATPQSEATAAEPEATATPQPETTAAEPTPSPDEEEADLELQPTAAATGGATANGDDGDENEPEEAPIHFIDPKDVFYVTSGEQDVSMTLDTGNYGENVTFRWTVGLCVEDDWVQGHVFTQGSEYEIDGNTITLHGPMVLTHRGGYGNAEDLLHVRIFVEAIDNNSTDSNPVIANDTHWIDFGEPHVNYENDREWDCDMLPDWESTVFRWYKARVWDADHPDGEEVNYEVLDVTSSDSQVVSVERNDWGEGEDADHNWRYKAKSHGTATLTVSYRTLEGDEDTYTFEAHVTPDVYDVSWEHNNISLGSNNSSRMGLPGQSIAIHAKGIHKHENADDRYDGFVYSWQLVDGGDQLASIGPVNYEEDGSCTAIVTFNEDTGYQQHRYLCSEVGVQLTASKDGKDVVRRMNLHLENEYPEVWIQETGTTLIDTQMAIGTPQEVTPEMRYYVQDFDPKYTLGTITRLTWGYDENAVRITYADGEVAHSGEGIEVQDGAVPTFTITRLKDWDTDISLSADWEPQESNGRFALDPADKGGDTPGWRHENPSWHLDRTSAEVFFAGGVSTFFVTDDNPTTTLPVDWDSIMNAPQLTPEYTVGLWDNDDWAEIFQEGVEYTTGPDGVTLNGEAILSHLGEGEDELNVRSVVVVRYGEDVLSENDRWTKVTRPSVDYDHDREWDRAMLPGWDGEVSRWYRARLRDEDHQNGDDVDYEVVNVISSDPSVVRVEREDWGEGEDADHKWRYQAKEFGEATLTVTYRTLGGEEATYDFRVNVGDRVYDASVFVSQGDSWALPGEHVILGARGSLWYLDDKGNQQYVDTSDPESGLSLSWRIRDGGEYGSLANTDGTTNSLEFLGAGEEGVDHDLWVEVTLYHEGNEVARGDTDVKVCDAYPTITPYPADFPSNLAVGTMYEVTPKQLLRTLEDGQAVERDVTGQTSFDLRFNKNDVAVEQDDGLVFEDEDDNTCHVRWTGEKALHITRLQNENTELNLDSSFDDDNWDSDSRSWRLEKLDYTLRFDDDNADAWVSRGDNGVFVRPKDAVATLWQSDELAALPGARLDVAVGYGDWDDEAFAWENAFDDQCGLWELVDIEGRTSVVVHADKMASLGRDEVCVKARICTGDKEQARSDNDCRIHLCEREYDYQREDDRDILPGWDGTVNGSYSVRVSDEDHPDGEDFEYRVMDVQVIDGADLLEFRKDFKDDDASSSDYWWYYRTKDGVYGTATLKVDYEVPQELGGGNASYTFDLHVTTDVYDVQVWSDDWSDFALPGARVQLHAQGVHHRVGAEDTSLGLSYEWEVVEGSDVGHLEGADAGVPNATFVVNDIGPDKMGFDDQVHVRVYVRDGGERVAEKGWAFRVKNFYAELWPTRIDGRIAVGNELMVQPEWRTYPADDDSSSLGYDVMPIAEFQWDCVDTSMVLITDEAGNDVSNNENRLTAGTACRIRRLSPEQTRFRLRCWVRDRNGGEQCFDRWYDLEGLDYWLDFDKDQSDVWVSYDDNGNPTNPTITSVTLNKSEELAAALGVTPDVAVGYGDWDDDRFEWSQMIKEGTDWELLEDNGQAVVRVDASRLAALGLREVRVKARMRYDDNEVARTRRDCRICLQEREWNLDREQDRNMLPGWDGSVSGHRNIRVRDEDHPDGEDFEYYVTDVRVVSGADLIEIHRNADDEDENDYWWYYRAKEGVHGTATLEVTYQVPEALGGGEASYTFDLNITSDVYDVNVWSEDWADNALPGTSVELHAQGLHHREDQEDTTEGLTYQWNVLEGSEIGYLEQDPSNPQHATFVINPMSQEKMGFDDKVRIGVSLSDQGSDVVAEGNWEFMVRNTYTELWPTHIDGHLAVGSEVTVDTQLRDYLVPDEPWQDTFAVAGAEFQWDCVDTSKVLITDGAGNDVSNSGSRLPAGTYTIKRLDNGRTRFQLRCWRHNDDGGEEYFERWYELDGLDYRLRFDEESVDVWYTRADDGSIADAADATTTLWVSDDLVDVQNPDPHIAVGYGNWDEDSFAWEHGFDAVSGVWEPHIVDGKLAITVHGAKLAELGVDNVCVRYRYSKDGVELATSENECWFNLQRRELDYGLLSDRSLLPGWDGTVDGRTDVWVRNESFPDGRDLDVVVTDVQVTEGADLVELRKEFKDGDTSSSDYWWYYRAKDDAKGDATIRVTYRIPDELGGGTDSYTFRLFISDEVYEVEAWRRPLSCIQPGGSADVYAAGALQRKDAHTILDGLDVRWEIEPSDDYTLEVDQSDPTHATITFRELREGENPRDYSCQAWPRAVLYTRDDDGQDVERASTNLCIDARANYTSTESSYIDPNLDVLATTTIDPKLVNHYVDDDDRLVSEEFAPADLQYYWSFEGFGEGDIVRIVNAAGEEVTNNRFGNNDGEVPAGNGPYTITRLRSDAGRLGLMARWTDEDGRVMQDETRYHLVRKFYETWFDASEYQTSDDCVAVAKLDMSRFASIPNNRWSYEVFVGDGERWNDGNFQGFDRQLAESDYTVTDNGDNTLTIEVPGELVGDGLTVVGFAGSAEAAVGYGAHARITIANASTHDLTHVDAVEATCDADGRKAHWSCSRCGKLFSDEAGTQVTTLDDLRIAKHHELEHVDAVAATCEAAGTAAHWKCGRCGKLFSDEAGTQQTTVDALTIAKVAHTLTHVPATPATYDAAGNKEYWKCTVCGSYFLDGAGTNKTTAAAVVIAKLQRTSIANATITFPSRTYNGKAQTTLPVVKMGSTTLADTDYTVSGSTAATNAGTYTVTVTGTGAYQGSRKVTYTIAPKAQTISATSKTVTFGTTANLGATVRDGDGALSYKSSNTGIVTVSATGVVTPVKVGSATITITAAKTTNYKATSTSVTVTVAPAAQTISASNKSVAVGKTVSLGAKATVGGGTLSYKSANTAIATVSTTGVVTPVKAGTVTITITAAAKGNYMATSKNVTVTVTLGTQSITAANKACNVGKTVAIGAKTSGDGKLTYASSNTGVATVSATGVITGKKAGSASITIKAAKTGKYNAASKKITVTVTKQANPMTVKAAKASITVTHSLVKSKAYVTANNATVAKAQGSVTYINASTNATAKKFAVNKTTGKVTIPKGTAKGTYPVVIKVVAAGNATYLSASKTVSYKVIVR